MKIETLLPESAIPTLPEYTIPTLEESAISTLKEAAIPTMEEAAVTTVSEPAIPTLREPVTRITESAPDMKTLGISESQKHDTSDMTITATSIIAEMECLDLCKELDCKLPLTWNFGQTVSIPIPKDKKSETVQNVVEAFTRQGFECSSDEHSISLIGRIPGKIYNSNTHSKLWSPSDLISLSEQMKRKHEKALLKAKEAIRKQKRAWYDGKNIVVEFPLQDWITFEKFEFDCREGNLQAVANQLVKEGEFVCSVTDYGIQIHGRKLQPKIIESTQKGTAKITFENVLEQFVLQECVREPLPAFVPESLFDDRFRQFCNQHAIHPVPFLGWAFTHHVFGKANISFDDTNREYTNVRLKWKPIASTQMCG